MVRLFRSKLLMPSHDGFLPRRRLLEAAAGARFLVAQAPAGAGKTVFLTQWATSLGRPALYYALDEQDRDPAVFAGHLLAGLRGLWSDWQAPEEAGANPETLAVELVNEAAARPPCTLVLDRLEAAFGVPYLADFLAVVVRYGPPSMAMALGTRSPLPGDLGHGGRQARVITATDLAMTEGEAADGLGETPWQDCLRSSGGFPLALELWRQVGAGWRETLAAHELAGIPPHVQPDVARALVADWIGGGISLAEFARQLSTGQPGAEAHWREVREIRNLLLAGDFAVALGALSPLLEQARAAGDRPLLGAVALLRGEYHYSKGEYGHAMEWYRQAFEADPLLETVGTHSAVAILRDQGQEQEAEQLALRCIAARQGRGDMQALAYAHAQYGSLLTGLDRFAEAEQHLTEGERLGLKLSGEPFYGILSLAYRAVLQAHMGNAAAYRQLAEQAYSLAKGRSRWLKAICGYILAFALFQWGEVEPARQFLAQALAYLTEIDSKWQRHMVLTYMARGDWARGMQDSARQHFDTALGLAAREGYVQFLSSRRPDAGELILDALVRGVEVPLCQELLARMGQRAEPALLNLASGERPEGRRAVLYPLSRIGSEQAAAAIRHLLYDPDEQVAGAAMMALRSMGRQPAPAPAPSPAPVAVASGAVHRLAIALLGPVTVGCGEQEVESWRTQKSRDLLSYLALSGNRPVTRDQLLEALWPDAEPEAAQASLHTTLYNLRRALRPAGENLISFAGGAYRLERDGVAIDLERFEQLAASGSEEDWQAAAALHRGELMEGLDYPWCDGPRTKARTTYLQLLRRLAGAMRSAGHHPGAVDWLQRLVQADPLSEDGHLGLMACYQAMGNRNAALQQYRTMVRLLDEELGLAPGPEAQALYRRLLD